MAFPDDTASSDRPVCILFADSDSQVFGAMSHATGFASAGWHVVFATVDPDGLPETALARIAGYDRITVALDELPHHPAVREAGALGIFATGSKLAAFRRALEEACATWGEGEARPAIFTGYNGLVYEKFEEGLAWRLGYDFIALNGERDRRAAVAFLGRDDDCFVITGIGHDVPPVEREPTARPMLLFAEQVIVPSSYNERAYLAQELRRLAEENPRWDIVVKPRINLHETTFHKVRHHIEPLILSNGPLPDNMEISYEPIEDLYRRARLFATISSTALFAALRAGIDSFVIGDFGIRNQLGTHVFVASGIMRNLHSITDLDAAEPVQCNPEWLADLGFLQDTRSHLVGAIARQRFTAGQFAPQFYAAASQDAFGVMREASTAFKIEMANGKQAFQERLYAQAAHAFAAAAHANPTSTTARRMEAEARFRNGDYAAARDALLDARRLKPENRRIARRLRIVSGPARHIPWLRNRFAFKV